MRASEIKAKYPKGTKIIDCFGQETDIRNNYLTISEFRPCYVLGSAYIYNFETKVWATIISDYE